MNKKQKVAQLIAKGKLKEAIKPQLQICKSQTDDSGSWLQLASLYGQTRDFQSVINICKRLQSRDSSDPAVYSLMGNACASIGKTAEARELYEKALALRPDDPGILNNLGNALYLEEKLEEAAAIFHKVIRLLPNYADAHNNLGNIYKALNDNKLAVKHYGIAIRLNPQLLETTLNLAHMYAERIGQPEIAEEYFRKAAAQNPESLESWSGVINMLRFQGKLDDALELIKRIEREYPDETGPIAAEADIYERTGKYDEAYRIIQRMLASGNIDPMAIDVFMRLCSRFDCCDEALQEGEKIASNPAVLPNFRQNTYFGLGKLYDKLGRYDEAFHSYRNGNRINDIPFSITDFSNSVDNLLSVYTEDNLAGMARSDIDSSRPIFIVGMPRSGTSLTEQILASHPDVCGAGELNDINDIVTGLPAFLNTPIQYPHCVSKLTREHLNELAAGYLEKLAGFSDKARHVTDKMPHNFLNVGIISLLFPQSRIIHCVRDPRDTCLSIYFQNFGWLHAYGTRLDWLGSYYKEYSRVMKHWESVISMPLLTVRYEDMVADQEATTRKLIDFCGLEWNDACLDFHRSKRVVATASYDQVREKIYDKSRARWKKYAEHITPLIDSLGDAINPD